MPKVTFLPHEEICPNGAEIEVEPGVLILDAALENGIEIKHACEKSCSCSTCHIIIRKGFSSLEPASEKEEDQLDKAWSVAVTSRLSCQTKMGNQDLTIQVPKYTINIADEKAH